MNLPKNTRTNKTTVPPETDPLVSPCRSRDAHNLRKITSYLFLYRFPSTRTIQHWIRQIPIPIVLATTVTHQGANTQPHRPQTAIISVFCLVFLQVRESELPQKGITSVPHTKRKMRYYPRQICIRYFRVGGKGLSFFLFSSSLSSAQFLSFCLFWHRISHQKNVLRV